MLDWNTVYSRLKSRIESYGIQVRAERLGFETTGIFDGLSITTNTDFDTETCCHNIAHSVGHIVQWSVDYPKQQALYDRLNAAKANKLADPEALEAALRDFREYEEEASEYATWLLAETDNAKALPAFTLFARADIEAIVGFHRDGIAPIWQEFFASWRARVEHQEIEAGPFRPKPIPVFTPIHITPQEVIQEVDGEP